MHLSALFHAKAPTAQWLIEYLIQYYAQYYFIMVSEGNDYKTESQGSVTDQHELPPLADAARDVVQYAPGW